MIIVNATLEETAGGGGGWTPADFGADLGAWYESSDSANYTAVSNNVSVWDDLSGNGNDLTQNTAGDRPGTGARTQNSLNVFDFDGTEFFDALNISDESQPITFALVLASDHVDNANRQAIGNVAGDGPTIYVEGDLYKYYAGTIRSSGVTETTAARIIVASFHSVFGSYLRIDGVERTTSSPGTAGLTVLSVGCDLVGGAGSEQGFWDGWIGELIVISDLVTGTNLTLLETYLNAKWAVY